MFAWQESRSVKSVGLPSGANIIKKSCLDERQLFHYLLLTLKLELLRASVFFAINPFLLLSVNLFIRCRILEKVA